MSFNKNEKYATIYGNDPDIKYRYVQDGKYYDAQFRRVDKAGRVIDKAKPVEKKETKEVSKSDMRVKQTVTAKVE